MDIKEIWLRKFSEKFLPFFKKISIPAEILVIFRMVFAIITAIVISFGGYFNSILFLTVYQFVFLFDYIDGKLARYQKRFSLSWLRADRIFHYFISFTFLFSLAYSTKNSSLVILAAITGFSFFIKGFFDTIENYKRPVRSSRKKIDSVLWPMIIESPFSIFFFGVILNLKEATVIIYSVFYLIGLVYKLLNIRKKEKHEKN